MLQSFRKIEIVFNNYFLFKISASFGTAIFRCVVIVKEECREKFFLPFIAGPAKTDHRLLSIRENSEDHTHATTDPWNCRSHRGTCGTPIIRDYPQKKDK